MVAVLVVSGHGSHARRTMEEARRSVKRIFGRSHHSLAVKRRFPREQPYVFDRRPDPSWNRERSPLRVAASGTDHPILLQPGRERRASKPLWAIGRGRQLAGGDQANWPHPWPAHLPRIQLVVRTDPARDDENRTRTGGCWIASHTSHRFRIHPAGADIIRVRVPFAQIPNPTVAPPKVCHSTESGTLR